MTTWTGVAQFLYGDVKSEDGFWYAHPLKEIEGLTEGHSGWGPRPMMDCRLRISMRPSSSQNHDRALRSEP